MGSVSYRFRVPEGAENARIAGAACPMLPDGEERLLMTPQNIRQ